MNPFRYIGLRGYFYDFDLLEYYLRARFYDPASGRFLSVDPILFAAGSMNLYGYVRNNPTNLLDPSGLQLTSDATTAGVTDGQAVTPGGSISIGDGLNLPPVADPGSRDSSSGAQGATDPTHGCIDDFGNPCGPQQFPPDSGPQPDPSEPSDPCVALTTDQLILLKLNGLVPGYTFTRQENGLTLNGTSQNLSTNEIDRKAILA